jgi:hypothetical protein
LVPQVSRCPPNRGKFTYVGPTGELECYPDGDLCGFHAVSMSGQVVLPPSLLNEIAEGRFREHGLFRDGDRLRRRCDNAIVAHLSGDERKRVPPREIILK